MSPEIPPYPHCKYQWTDWWLDCTCLPPPPAIVFSRAALDSRGKHVEARSGKNIAYGTAAPLIIARISCNMIIKKPYAWKWDGLCRLTTIHWRSARWNWSERDWNKNPIKWKWNFCGRYAKAETTAHVRKNVSTTETVLNVWPYTEGTGIICRCVCGIWSTSGLMRCRNWQRALSLGMRRKEPLTVRNENPWSWHGTHVRRGCFSAFPDPGYCK